MHVGNWEDSRTYYMEDRELSVVSCEKDLGVWISSDMKCSKQSMYACNKAMKVLGMIKRTIRFKDTRVMLNKAGLLHGLIRRALGLPGGFSGW